MKQSPTKATQLLWIIEITTKSVVQTHPNIFVEEKKKKF